MQAHLEHFPKHMLSHTVTRSSLLCVSACVRQMGLLFVDATAVSHQTDKGERCFSPPFEETEWPTSECPTSVCKLPSNTERFPWPQEYLLVCKVFISD